MTQDAVLFVRTFFSLFWHFVTDWDIPGTNINIATWAFFLIATALAIRHFKGLFGFIESGVKSDQRAEYRASRSGRGGK